MKELMYSIIMTSVIIFTITGCSVLLENSGALERVDKWVSDYCEQVSNDERLTLRDSFRKISDHSIEIHCNVSEYDNE